MAKHWAKKKLGLAGALMGGVLIGAVLTVGLGSLRAVEDPPLSALSAPLVIPYDGFLELGGQPVTGPFNLRFSLYASVAEDAESLWSDQHLLGVLNGRFTALLGTGIAFPTGTDSVFQQEALYIGVEVEDPDTPGSWHALGGRQRVLAVPHAYLSAQATDFLVEGTLAVGGDVAFHGDVTVGAESTSTHQLGGTVRTDDLYINSASLDDPGQFDVQRWLVDSSGETFRVVSASILRNNLVFSIDEEGPMLLGPSGSRLTIPDGGNVVDGSDPIVAQGTLTITGDVYVDEDVAIAGDVVVSAGGLSVGGDVNVTTSDIAVTAGGLTAAATTVSDVNVSAGSAAVAGGSTFGGELRLMDRIDMDEANPHNNSLDDAVEMRTNFVADDETTDPNYISLSDSHLDCFVAGFSFQDGDINEGHNGNIMRAFTYFSTRWYTRADWVSHNPNDNNGHESKRIGVACVNGSWSRMQDWYSTSADGT